MSVDPHREGVKLRIDHFVKRERPIAWSSCSPNVGEERERRKLKPRRHVIKPWATPPKNARLVYKGRVFSVYQRKQKMFSGRHGSYEAVWRPARVNIVAMVGCWVLMTRERQPGIRGWYLGMPGGRAMEGETPLYGGKRELLEETEYVSHDWTSIGVEQARSVTRGMSCRYLARNCKQVAEQSTHPSEIVEVFSIDLNRFLRNTVSMYGSVLTDFAEMIYNRRMRDAFARGAFASGHKG